MTSNRPAPLYCWDSCVVLAWFKDEKDKPLADMELVVREIDSGKAMLLMSVVTYVEVLDITKSKGIAKKFRQFANRSNVRLADVTPRVAEIAARFRRASIAQHNRTKKTFPKIAVADSIHLATASLFEARVFHTFDTGLLKLNGTAAVGGMKIIKPVPLSGARGLYHE